MHPFQVMAEPIRRRIVEILASGEHTSGEICESIAVEFGVTRAAASWHLRILRDNNWVHMRPDSGHRAPVERSCASTRPLATANWRDLRGGHSAGERAPT